MIKIVSLLENTTVSSACKAKHGLSLYIETAKHKILFDLGPNGLFLQNAEALGIDVKSVDAVILSHGHVDHGGGLGRFLQTNERAKIYLRPQATDKHFVKVLGLPFFCGINADLVKGDRFVFTDELTVVDDEITLFSDVKKTFPLPKADDKLLAKTSQKTRADDFCHEQNLILTVDGKTTLVCGCAHAGIANILNDAKRLIGRYPDTVIGGFHLYEPASKKYESKEYIDSVANELLKSGSVFFTCHCTGIKAYEIMKRSLNSDLSYLHTGDSVVLYEND